MSNVSAQVIQSMFNHLTGSYSEDEAREILIQKYPEEKTTIHKISVVPAFVDETEDVAEKVEKAVKKAVVKSVKPKAAKNTKMDQARALFASASDKSRKAMINVFIDQLGMSAAGASTYFYAMKK